MDREEAAIVAHACDLSRLEVASGRRSVSIRVKDDGEDNYILALHIPSVVISRGGSEHFILGSRVANMINVGRHCGVGKTEIARAASSRVVIGEVEDRDLGVDVNAAAADSYEGKAPACTSILVVASTQIERVVGSVEE